MYFCNFYSNKYCREVMEKYVVNPVVIRMQESARGSIYQSIVAMGFRARQINYDIKHEINTRIADLQPSSDESEGANDDVVAISREFDKLPKPTFIAMKEIKDGSLRFELPNNS